MSGTTWTSGTLDVPGAHLHHELAGPDGAPVVVLVGHPAGADDFRDLGAHLATDHRVLLHDPRGFGASPLDDPDDDADPDRLADDVAALLDAVAGPDARADVFGSSGGAVTGLAFAARHPDRLRMLVAHEPPLFGALPDGAERRADAERVVTTLHAQGVWPAMGAFMALAGFEAPEGSDHATDPHPPADPTDQHVVAMTRMLDKGLLTVCGYDVDVEGLRAAEAAGARVVLAAGRESGRQLARRGAEGVAALLDREAAMVTGGHVDWVPWMGGDPERFARQLRALLA
ncbi:alpha/beta fold hydrolase [Quadrisphaera oryzae]|uniref:alpha/beta fold hydrolase n=1 Tax=Quadrisphaera TaxID=317661 RepID=UPI0016446AA0|nr:alpha/beta hydrolase [Quadrisphaera sp. RL12-1S]MBC3761846.1 alpha/beta hydrolase [Quadrisphaera sp. RL12-1S]